MKRLYLSVIIIFLMSCQTKQEKIKNIFTGNKKCKCWVGVNEARPTSRWFTKLDMLDMFYFDDSLNWYPFNRNSSLEQFEREETYDMVFDNKFSIISDSVIKLNEWTHIFKIENKNSIFIKRWYSETIHLIPVPDTLYKYMQHKILQRCIR